MTSPWSGNDGELGVEISRALGGDDGLGAAGVLLAKEDRPRKIGWFDRVEIDQVSGSQSQEGEVLHHLIAQRARADNQDSGRAKPILAPPGDQAETAVPVLVVDDERVGRAALFCQRPVATGVCGPKDSMGRSSAITSPRRGSFDEGDTVVVPR